jgi:hypothetical protein
MADFLFPGCAAVAWIVLFSRLPDLRRSPRDPGLIAVITALAILAVATTCAVRPIFDALNEAALRAGLPNLTILCLHSCVVALSAVVQVMLISWTAPAPQVWPRARRRLAGGGIAVLVMIVLFVAAGVGHTSPDYVLEHAGRPIVAAYMMAYLIFFTIGLIQTARLCLPVARVVDKPALRRSLRFAAAGAITGMGYTTGRVADIIGAQLGVDIYLWEPIAILCAAAGGLLLLVGLMIPLWAPKVAEAADWLRSWRTYRRLFPLWRVVDLAMPEVVLARSHVAWFDRISPWRLRFRLYRRVIEIQDARLAVRGHLGPDLLAAAARRADGRSLNGVDRQAFVEAVALRSALLACRAGAPATAGPVVLDHAAGVDPAAELAWLLKLADVFDRQASALPVGPIERAGSSGTTPVPASGSTGR